MKIKDITTRDRTVISVIITYFVSVSFLNVIIDQLFGVGGMIPSIVGLCLFVFFCYKTTLKIEFSAPSIVMIIYCSALYVFTRNTSVTTLFGREFLFYFIMAGILAMYKCDTEKVLRYIAYASLAILPFYNEIFVEITSSQYHTYISMGLSYAMTPLLSAGILHLCFYRRRKGIIIKLVYLIDIFLMMQLILKGSRGAVLLFAIAFAYIYINRFSGGVKNKTSVFRIIIVFIIAIFIGTYFYDILEFLADLLESMDIEARFIEKIFMLSDQGDISNGRTPITEYTLEEFWKSPIWGHGMSTIYYNSGGKFAYPHNFILQLLYDGGVLLTVPVIIIIVRTIWYSLVGEDNEERVFAIYLVVVSLPKNMFSADVWESALFWFMVFHSLRYHKFSGKTLGIDS